MTSVETYDEDAKAFWASISTLNEQTAESLYPVRVTIVSDDGAGNIVVTRDSDPDQEPEGATHPRTAGFKFSPGDPAYALPLGNDQLLILGRLVNSPFTQYTLDHSLILEGGITATNGGFESLDVSGTFTGNRLEIDYTSGSLYIAGNLDTSASNLIRTTSISQSSADTASTTSTVTYVTACEVSITIPVPGTWVIEAIGGALLQHSAGSANFLVQIDGDDGTARTLALTTEAQVIDNHVYTLNNGSSNVSITVRFRYKSSTAGTASARNPWLFVVARRSAFS